MFFVVKRKYSRAGFSAFLILALCFWFRLSFTHAHVRRSIDLDSASINLVGYEVEKSRRINAFANKLMKRKIREDVEDVFFALDTTISHKQTELTIPSYFDKKKLDRIPKGPFDPRLTLAAYYNYLAHNSRPLNDIELPFHWSDWVDMAVLDPIIFKTIQNFSCSFFDHRRYENETYGRGKENSHLEEGALDPNAFCKMTHGNSSELDIGFVFEKHYGRMTENKAVAAARSYLYTLAPNPESILFLTKDGSYHVRVSRTPSALINGNEVSDLLAEHKKSHKSINTLEIFKKLMETRASQKKYVVADYEIHLKHEDFVIDATRSLLNLNRKQNERRLTRHEENYQRALLTSLTLQKDPPKYFQEAKVYDTLVADHYDWRFFGGFNYQTKEASLTLHRLTRTWLSFTRKLGLNSWVAHGTLLAWHFNGMNFPWDDDVDVQMPIQDLLKLSEYFNQTMIVEDAEDGFGRFFLDCATYVTAREHGNGNNNIDARFIDVDSGLYIDITALAVSSDKPSKRFHHLIPEVMKNPAVLTKDINNSVKLYNCRNYHFVTHAEISPLVRTFFDGELAYVPKNYPTILGQEYNDGFTRRYHNGWVYIGQLRIWVHQRILMTFLRHPLEWDEFFKSRTYLGTKLLPETNGGLSSNELLTLQNLSELDIFRLLHHDEVFLSYQKSKEITMFHETEGMRLLVGKSTEAMVKLAPDLPPLRYEPFLHLMRQDFMHFEGNVERYKKLAQHVVANSNSNNVTQN